MVNPLNSEFQTPSFGSPSGLKPPVFPIANVYLCVCPGDATHSHGAQVSDFPGCFSAADDWQDLPRLVQEAVEVWCMGESDMDSPAPTALDQLAIRTEFAGGVWMLVDIDVSKLDVKAGADETLSQGRALTNPSLQPDR